MAFAIMLKNIILDVHDISQKFSKAKDFLQSWTIKLSFGNTNQCTCWHAKLHKAKDKMLLKRFKEFHKGTCCLMTFVSKNNRELKYFVVIKKFYQ